jgi:alpha-L-fucosidase
VIDLGEAQNICGFRYLPDQVRSAGIISGYQFYVSADNSNWTLTDQGEFPNINNNPIWQTKTFTPVTVRYIRLRALKNTKGTDDTGYAEIDVLTR